MITGIITGASFLVLVQIAVVLIGWRFNSMRPAAIRVRDEAVDRWEKSAPGWDDDDVEALADLTRDGEERSEEDEDAEAAHFREWRAELAGEKQIAKYERRMDRWSQ